MISTTGCRSLPLDAPAWAGLGVFPRKARITEPWTWPTQRPEGLPRPSVGGQIHSPGQLRLGQGQEKCPLWGCSNVEEPEGEMKTGFSKYYQLWRRMSPDNAEMSSGETT